VILYPSEFWILVRQWPFIKQKKNGELDGCGGVIRNEFAVLQSNHLQIVCPGSVKAYKIGDGLEFNNEMEASRFVLAMKNSTGPAMAISRMKKIFHYGKKTCSESLSADGFKDTSGCRGF
jgi:hypothetical protein